MPASVTSLVVVAVFSGTVDHDRVNRRHPVCRHIPYTLHPRPGLNTMCTPLHTFAQTHVRPELPPPPPQGPTPCACQFLLPRAPTCTRPLLRAPPCTTLHHPHPSSQADALLARFPDLLQAMGVGRVPLAQVVGHLAAVYEGEGEAAGEGEGEPSPGLEEHLGHLR